MENLYSCPRVDTSHSFQHPTFSMAKNPVAKKQTKKKEEKGRNFFTTRAAKATNYILKQLANWGAFVPGKRLVPLLDVHSGGVRIVKVGFMWPCRGHLFIKFKAMSVSATRVQYHISTLFLKIDSVFISWENSSSGLTKTQLLTEASRYLDVVVQLLSYSGNVWFIDSSIGFSSLSRNFVL